MEKNLEEKKILKRFNVIAILAITIGLIALIYPTVVTLKRMGAEDSYERIVKRIKVAAILWADDNEIKEPMLITVNKLIEDGYVEADSNGELLNPQASERILNCHTIYITNELGKHQVIFNKENDCELVKSEQLNFELVATDVTGKVLKTGEESKNDIYLEVVDLKNYDTITWLVDGNIIPNTSNTLKLFVSSTASMHSTYSVKVVTEYGNKEFSFIVNLVKLQSDGR